MYRQMQNHKLDRTNIHEFGARFTAALKEHIENVDGEIGEALQEICPNPEDLTEADARELIERHMDVVVRAFQGTTLALALVNLDQRFMWAGGVGDSTVGESVWRRFRQLSADFGYPALSTVGSDGKRKAERLCELHTFKDPKEYYRAVMAHSYDEQPLLDWEDRMLGWLAIPRGAYSLARRSQSFVLHSHLHRTAIGDFAMKLRASYLTNLFNFTPHGDAYQILKYAPKIVTPPYVIAEPSVCFLDLEPLWGEQNKLLLFTDGVDNLVDGYLVFSPEKHSGADPVNVVSALLSDEVDPDVERILGHPIDPHWSGDVDNKAIDILGNLLGGADVERLEMVTDEGRLTDTGEGWPFHIDDTSIIVWGLADV